MLLILTFPTNHRPPLQLQVTALVPPTPQPDSQNQTAAALPAPRTTVVVPQIMEAPPSGSTSGTSEGPADDPFHLFWVPASLHPEIAPAEFRAFLKEHARTPPPGEGSSTVERSNSAASLSGAGLGRKKSMLSRQYKPSEDDGVENEQVVPLRRNRSNRFANRGPPLTISDLQVLEELAEEASESDDPSRLRTVLRRSLSLNLSPTGMSFQCVS